MYQRDYILRIIEHLAQVLIVLRDRILGRQPAAGSVQDEIRAIAEQTGIDLDVARTVDTETLRLLMSFAGDLDPARCWLTAELLYLEALNTRHAGDAAAAHRNLERALVLHGWLPPDWTPFPELPPSAERIREIRTLIGELET